MRVGRWRIRNPEKESIMVCISKDLSCEYSAGRQEKASSCYSGLAEEMEGGTIFSKAKWSKHFESHKNLLTFDPPVILHL